MKCLVLLLSVYPCLAESLCPDTELRFNATCTISGIRNGKTPSSDWQLRHMDSFQTLSHSK